MSRYESAQVRYFLLGFSQDILEVRQLAKAGGIGPIGPGCERMYWHDADGTWKASPDG